MHWDDGRKTLVIGERKGEFPGLRKERTFRIVCVQEGIGAGAQTESKADREVKYDGHRLAIDLSKPR
jgi:alpha-D-xyloside xylohydrolase